MFCSFLLCIHPFSELILILFMAMGDGALSQHALDDLQFPNEVSLLCCLATVILIFYSSKVQSIVMFHHLCGYEETTVLRLPRKSRPLSASLLSKSNCNSPQQQILILNFKFHFLSLINTISINLGFFKQ